MGAFFKTVQPKTITPSEYIPADRSQRTNDIKSAVIIGALGGCMSYSTMALRARFILKPWLTAPSAGVFEALHDQAVFAQAFLRIGAR